MLGFDYRRTAALTPGLAVAVSVCLLADTVLLLLLYLLDTGFSTDAAYEAGVRDYDVRRSVSDVLLVSFAKACVLCAFWSLAWGKPVALAATAGSTFFAIAKLALLEGDWGAALLRVAVLFIPLPASVIEGVAVAKTRYTYDDPDWALAEKVEAEQRQRRDAAARRKVAAAAAAAVAAGGGDGDGGQGMYAPLLAEEGGGAVEAGRRQRQQQQQQQPLPSQPATTDSTLYLLFRYAAPDAGLLAAGLGFILLSSLFRLALPNFAARLLTLVVQGAATTANDNDAALGTPAFTEAAAYFAMCAAGLAAFTALRIWTTAKAEVRLVARLQRILFVAILRQDIATFDAQGTGALTSRLTSDCTLLGSIFTTNVNVCIQSGINLLGSTAYLFVLDARLAGAYSALVLLFFVVTRTFGAHAKKLQREIQSLKAEANQAADQGISLVRLVRAFAAEEVEKRRYDERTLSSVSAELRVKMLYSVYVPIVSLLENSLVLTVVLLGAYLVARGGMAGSDLTAFYFYSTTITAAMQSLADNVLSLLTGLGAGAKLMEIIAAQPTIPIKGGAIPPRPPSTAGAAVEFEDVSLAYDAPPVAAGNKGGKAAAAAAVVDGDGEEGNGGKALTTTTVIDHLSLQISPGERVAVVGLSGSGKSSLVSLLLRLYTPSTGRIRLDGVDIAGLDPRFLRSQIGVVTQEAPLLGGISVRENIVYALPGGREAVVTDEEVEAAARAAAIHERVLALPRGYATIVGERGATLSGGERQRVAIARALLRRPRLLILDEATSALDTQREAEVQEALLALHRARGMSMLIIAHRLSTVQDADRIIVLSAGRIRESGTHAELLQLGGLYKSLVERQLREEEVVRHEKTAAAAGTTTGVGK